MRAPHAIASGMVILSALAPASAQESAPTSAPAEPAVRPVTQARIMPPPPPWPEQTRRNSTGMMVTGIVLTSLGAVALPAGVAVIAADVSNGDDVAIAAVLVGFPLVIGSGVFAAVGIPLWVIGAREVPVRPGDEEARAVQLPIHHEPVVAFAEDLSGIPAKKQRTPPKGPKGERP